MKLTKSPRKSDAAGQESPADPPSAAPTYAAPALEKGLDILELLSQSNIGLTQVEIAERLGRSVGEIYRMLACLVGRNYVVNISDKYAITTKLFALAHSNPPTNRLLVEAAPIMQRLTSDLKQACHLTVYHQGRQIVIAKVDNPSGLGFSLRVGADLDVLVSASGQVLLAFQDLETRALRIRESTSEGPRVENVSALLADVRARGFASIVSAQIKGLYAVSYPVLDTTNRAIAALTVPYAERIDLVSQATIPDVEAALGKAARLLSQRIGWRPDAEATDSTEARGER